MRRAIILALLFVGVQLIVPLGAPGAGSQSLLGFGFLILAAYTVGELFAAMRAPKLVGYLVAGLVFGPNVLAAVGKVAIDRLSPVSDLAIALIAFLAGAELRWAEIRERGVAIVKIMSSELLVSFVAIFATIVLLHGFLPSLASAASHEVLAFGILFASVAIVHSPAVTLALLSETGARGVVARTTLGVVLLADVAVVLFFSGALAFARTLVPPPGGLAGSSALVLWETGGAVLVGAALGGLTALYLRFVHRELFFFAILIAFFGAAIARVAHVETLLTLLVAGFVTENAGGGRGESLRHAMERAAAPVFVVFFALAGARIDPSLIISLWPLVVPLAVVRGGGIWLGTMLGARWARVEPAVARYAWMGLVSQAGVAIGLSAVLEQAYPVRGGELRTIFLAVIAINETLGPILFRRALVASGEAPGAGAATNRRAAGPAGAASPAARARETTR